MNIESIEAGVARMSRFDKFLAVMSSSAANFVICGIEAGAVFDIVVRGELFWVLPFAIIFMCLFWHQGMKQLKREMHIFANVAIGVTLDRMQKEAREMIDQLEQQQKEV